MTQIRERYHFIHNVFANFFKDTLNFFSECLYPRFEYTVVGTYDKAVEYIVKQCELGREADRPTLPALILNPTGDFLPADANAGGRQYWRYPNLSPSMIKRLFDPVYIDQNIEIHAGFLRVKGEIELIMLLNSFYEYCDVRMLFINMFGGLDRIIYPRFFSSFIILPDEFIDYEYFNEYTGKTYKIDWSTSSATDKLVKTIASQELVLPLNIKPQYSLTGLSDASNRYGGTDGIAEWKLSATINYELELPNYLVFESDYLANTLELNINYGSAYSSSNDYQPPDNRILYDVDWKRDINEDTDTPGYTAPADSTAILNFDGDFVYSHRYFHTVTAAEAATCDSTNNIELQLPERIDDEKLVIVNSKDGQLHYGDHYLLYNIDATSNTYMIIMTGNSFEKEITDCPPVSRKYPYICLKEGWVLEIFVYKKLETL
jgi:hypothetical protein